MEDTSSTSSAVEITLTTISPSSKKLARQKEREERINGKLTDLRFDSISCMRGGRPDFIIRDVLRCVLGSRSQFDARLGRMKNIMPPLTIDCCQTFATLSAVLLSSLGRAEMFWANCNVSTVNYLLYLSAWLHQLTRTSWPKCGLRPSVSDLKSCLFLNNYFPTKVEADKFLVVFYNQSEKILELLRQICTSHAKRPREEGESSLQSVCGYVVVSGDYTVSIFSMDYHFMDKSSGYSKAWSLFICDSHGTQPWSRGKASICGVTFGQPATANKEELVLSVDDGIRYFSTILFTLLEEHRTAVPRSDAIPYMTWTPLSRRRSQFYSSDDLKRVMVEHWLPKVLAQTEVSRQIKINNFKLLPCFWGLNKDVDNK